MNTEREKMLAGQVYDAWDPDLVEGRLKAREACHQINTLAPREFDQRRAELTSRLFGAQTDCYITPTFRCDYGVNIRLGQRVYFNFDCVILDVCEVIIGDHTLFGPGCHVYTAVHPMDSAQRRIEESGKPVWIGSDVWLGGGVIVCPGVRIGDRAVIGAGSVVTRDIPTGVFAAGNPCRPIRAIETDATSASA